MREGAGYQKALERGNSVPRAKGFCEADKVKLSAVLLQNKKCCNLRVIDIMIFNRPGVAGAVLQTPSSLIDSVSESAFSSQSSRYHKSQSRRARELKF